MPRYDCKPGRDKKWKLVFCCDDGSDFSVFTLIYLQLALILECGEDAVIEVITELYLRKKFLYWM